MERSLGPALGLALLLALASTPARAGDSAPDAAKVRCRASYENAQVLRRAEQFKAARAQLAVCRETCPAPLAAECAAWNGEIETLVPTVRLDARDQAMRAVEAVRVFVDGRLVDDAISGPVRVDPGVHVFRFEAAGKKPVEVRVEVHAGEREHPVTAVLEPAVVLEPRAVASSPSLSQQPSRVPAYVVGGLGVLALGTGAALALVGHSERAVLRGSCAPHCDQADVDAIATLWWAAAASGAAGAVLLGTAFVLFPHSSAPRAGQLSAQLPAVGVGVSGVSLHWNL